MSFFNKLEEKWKITIALLDEAKVEISKLDGVDEYIAKHETYLKHNELEIALDMLEEAALETTSAVPSVVWVKLKKSADSMGLENRSEFYVQQLSGT